MTAARLTAAIDAATGTVAGTITLGVMMKTASAFGQVQQKALAGAPEKFFNKTNPQNLNAQTLPPQFDLAAGHQLQSGQAVPLASFPEGDYRLEIKVTDKIANKLVTRDVNFTVTAP